MTVNPYTLNMLYQNGIIDYVPTELMMPMAAGNMSMQNPYMNLAMQGNLYQQYGNSADSFSYSGNSQIGLQSNSFSNGLGNGVTGSKSTNSIAKMFGFDGIGQKSEAGISMFGSPDIGSNSNINLENTYGGFGDVKYNVTNGVNGISSTVSQMPTLLKGLIAGGLIILTLFGMFRGGKKPSKTAEKSFWSKLNPVNWFKKTEVKPEPKLSFWQKIKNTFSRRK